MNLYGFFIFLGLLSSILSFIFFIKFFLKKNFNFSKEEKNKILDFFLNIYFFSFLGGKIFFLIFHHNQFLNFKDFISNGFSILGASLFGFSYFLHSYQKDKYLKNFFFSLPIFINLIHSFGRIGCLYADCCGGSFFGFKIQIVSSIWYFINFFLSLIFIAKIKNKNKDKLFFYSSILYISSISLERIIFDFFREDKILILKTLSLYQILGFFIFIYLLNKILKINKNN